MKVIDVEAIKKTAEFARLHAHISGDGYTTLCKIRRSAKELLEHPRKNLVRNRYSIRYVNCEDSLVQGFVNDIKTLFNRKVVKLHKSEYEIAGKWIYDIFTRSGALKSNTWFIPPEISNGTNELKKEWLKAFFDDEGYVPKDRNRIELNTINKYGMEQVKSLLNDLGIECKIAGPYHNKNPNAHLFYRIRICGVHIKKFAETISFSYPKKLQRLKQMLKRIKWGRWDAQNKAQLSLPI